MGDEDATEDPTGETAGETARPTTSPLDSDETWQPGLRPLLEAHAREFVLAVRARGELVGSTQQAALGYTPEEQGGHHIAETLHPDDLPRVFDVLERARRHAGFEEDIRVRARHRDGTWHVLAATIIAVTDAALDFEGAVVRVRDVTDELPPDQALDLDVGGDDGRFLSLAEAVPLGILSADARGWVVYANSAAIDLFGLESNAMLGSGWTRAVLAEDLDDVVRTGREVIRDHEPREVTFRLATGLFQRWVHARFVPLGDERTTGWIATLDDVTERRRAESRLAHMATHDSLTGLPNRVLLEDRLRQAYGRLRRGSHSVTVVFVDLDDFKDVNDQFGHAVGDAVLVETARRLRAAVRDVDTIARLGGDEFVVVCESLSDTEAEEVLQRLRRNLAAPFTIDGERLGTPASFGAVTTSEPTEEIEDLLGRADQAMYRVKHARRAGTDPPWQAGRVPTVPPISVPPEAHGPPQGNHDRPASSGPGDRSTTEPDGVDVEPGST
ncbi:MAG: diguanylate cyclase [Acidimicrobiia bacterium]|nr:diguanylate cyclase [Acidimicrobiia bacterium]